MQWICHSPQTGWENSNKFLPYITTKGIYGNGKLTSSGKLSGWGCELTCVCTWNPGSAWCMIEVISSLRIVKFALNGLLMFVIDFNLVNLSIITCLICPIIGKESSWGLSNHKHVNSSPSAKPQKGKTKGEPSSLQEIWITNCPRLKREIEKSWWTIAELIYPAWITSKTVAEGRCSAPVI